MRITEKKQQLSLMLKINMFFPGLINMHGHLQDERAGKPMPFQYQYNLWLGSGITTHRDVGSDIPKAIKEREKSVNEFHCSPAYPFIHVVSGWKG